jgi:hypothetical protein
LDLSNKNIPDLSSDTSVTDIEDFGSLKTYFSRLQSRNETTGKVYSSIILAQHISFKAVMEKALSSLRNQNMGLYPKALDHERTSDVSWLLYSTRQQDEARLADLIPSNLGELIGLKWKQIRTTEGFRKPDPNNPQRKILALHIEGPSERASELCIKLSQWYSSSAKQFLDGTKVRLIPPVNVIFVKRGQSQNGDSSH